MLREIELDGVKYQVSTIPSPIAPYMRLYSKLIMSPPENIEDAAKMEPTIRKCMEKILENTVKPNPRPEHEETLFEEVMLHTGDVKSKRLRSFRNQSTSKDSGRGRSPTPQKTM